MTRDLRALFSSNDPVGTDEAFTNREAQWRQAATALTDHLARITVPGFDVQDLEAPRHNVIMFHGVGGIGKTTLSRKLEAALTDTTRRPAHWGQPTWPDTPRLLPARIDLSRAAGGDFERLILMLRLALAPLDRALPAFDIALARYWERNHPGESLEEYLRRSGLVTRFGKALPGQVQTALAKAAEELALPGVVGSTVGRIATAAVRAARERHITAQALVGCRRLADLLEADTDVDALSFYPHLLAYEIDRLPARKATALVVLLDTFEETGDRTHRDLERLIQHVVWLMPNVFFVISGRNRLQWADPALEGQLDYTGPTAWPDLAAHIPGRRTTTPAADSTVVNRQILIGDFSPEDCNDYLARRLTHDGQPLIPHDLRTVISARSHGLPLYLDLAVMRFIELRRTRTPQPGDFDHDFPALIARTVADLTPDERHVLRAVSLLDAFDLTLATATAGMTHQAPAQRLAERPFIRHDPYALWPYHLHAVVRSTIRDADDQTDDRWSDHDWQDAAQRAFTAIGDQWTTQPTRSRLLLIACLRQGLTLARDFDLPLGWLTEATYAYVDDSIWEPVTAPTPTDPSPATLATAADALTELLSALARRQHEHRAQTVDRLQAVLDTGLLPDELADVALYYKAKAERDLGRSTDSRHGMQIVAEHGGRSAASARRGLAHLARVAGDFPAALAAAGHLGWDGRRHRVDGDIWWPHGDIPRAATAYETARTQAEQHDVAGERAICQAQRAYVLAFTDPEIAADEIDLAEQFLTGLDLRATTYTVRTAELLRDAGADDLEDRITALRAETATAGVRAVQADLELAAAFHHAVRGDRTGWATAVGRLGELASRGDYPHYVDIAQFMADLPLEHTSTTQWLDEEEIVRARWKALVASRRNHRRL